MLSDSLLPNALHESNGHPGPADNIDDINLSIAAAGDFDDESEPTIEEQAEHDELIDHHADTLPRINASEQDLKKVTEQCWQAIQKANDPPMLFRYGGNLARIEADDDGGPVVRKVDHDRMRHLLARCAEWYRLKKSGDDIVEEKAKPPKDVVDDVLACPNPDVPILTRIVEAPTFAANGDLQTEPGYHPASRTYFAPAPGFNVPSISDRPTAEELARAKSLICDDMLGDFPFVGDAERSHAVALYLLTFARDLIPGATPLHLIEKPMPGSGATLLVDMLMWPALGRPVPAMTEGRDEDEWRKRLTSKLRSGSPITFVDNLKRRLDCAALSSAITSPTWEDRLLGFSELVKIPVRCVWAASGNNPLVSTEISRRTVRTRLDAKMDQPWMREEKQFRHPNLREWVAANRGQLVWTALTIIQAWLAAGRPQGSKTLGMFEAWARTMGGILDVAGIPGFLGNLQAFYAESDFEGGAWRAFVGAWWDRHQGASVGVADLFSMLGDGVDLPLGDGNERSQKIRLGKIIADNRDRQFTIQDGDDRLQVRLQSGGTLRRASLWKLGKVQECECVNVMNENSPLHAPAHARTHTGDLAENMSEIHNIHTDEEQAYEMPLAEFD